MAKIMALEACYAFRALPSKFNLTVPNFESERFQKSQTDANVSMEITFHVLLNTNNSLYLLSWLCCNVRFSKRIVYFDVVCEKSKFILFKIYINPYHNGTEVCAMVTDKFLNLSMNSY